MKRVAVLSVVLWLAVIGLALAEDVNMAGVWNVTFTDVKGAMPVFTLKQEGTALTGTYKGRFGESPVKGTVTGNAFQLSYTARGSETIYRGTVEGNTMKGTATFTTMGNTADFTGQKQP